MSGTRALTDDTERPTQPPAPRIGPLARLVHQPDPRPVLVVLDALAVGAGLWLAYLLSPFIGQDLAFRHQYERVAALVLLLSPALIAWSRLYVARYISSPADEARRLVMAAGLLTVATAALATLLKVDLSRAWVVTTFPCTLATLLVERAAVRRAFDRLRETGVRRRRVLIVGGNTEARALCHMLQRERRLGYEVIGFVDDERQAVGAPVLGPVADTLELVHLTGATGVVVAATAIDLATSNRLVRQLNDAGVHVELSSTLHDVAPNRLTVRPLGRFPVVYVEPVIRHGWRAVAKRCFDASLSFVGLVVAAPVLAMAAVAIKVDSRGPVLFRQERVGRDGRRFNVLKLRTMHVDAEERLQELLHLNEADGPLFKLRNDPRVTRVGRVLRKTSIDELPQLFNVLRNEMSLVGPRPALPREVAEWGPELHQRLRVLPGITGAWQVSGRSDASFDEYARLDLSYVDNWSLVTDLAILLKTVPAVVLSKGAR
jgi:exopolysaccharide biosynthesis polyprenyl glycosylphosphotransferase